MASREKFITDMRQLIKDVGRELINRADEFIPDSAFLTSEVDINIKISAEFPGLPLITISRLTPCETTEIRLARKVTEDE